MAGILSADANLYRSGVSKPVHTIPLLLSPDGRYVLAGEFIDATVDPAAARMAKMNLENSHVRGDASAPVTLVEYADFFCGYCSRAYNVVVRDLLPKYEGKVRLFYKTFPISSAGRLSALALHCAGKQGADPFWRLHDYIYENHASLREESVLKSKITEKSKELGLDKQKFDKCLSFREASDILEAEIAEARALGVGSTPTFFINGKKIKGFRPIKDMKELVEAELSKK